MRGQCGLAMAHEENLEALNDGGYKCDKEVVIEARHWRFLAYWKIAMIFKYISMMVLEMLELGYAKDLLAGLHII